MTQAKISNNSLAFTETGQGPAIVLLHGLFGSSDNLGRLASDLATDHRVVSVDLPGHGLSAPINDYGHETVAAMVSELLMELKLGRMCLVGHSLGGKVAMQMASTAEKNSAINLSKLVIIDIAPRHYPPNHNDVFAALNDVPLGPDIDRRQADKILSSHISEPGSLHFC